MQFQYPHTIENGGGERLTYKRLVKDPDGDYLEIENVAQPNSGAPMHVHHKQDEVFTVVSGRMAAQFLGEAPKFYEVGETAVFKAGVPHKFWCVGEEPLRCTGYVRPALNFEYFLTHIYESTKYNGGKRPSTFDAAYLLDRYRSEFDMLDIPGFVKKAVFPLVLFFGKLMGKHRKFKGAPAAA
jgi:mannose-6-phosphate isomerase-like protein (cupin superfamily)